MRRRFSHWAFALLACLALAGSLRAQEEAPPAKPPLEAAAGPPAAEEALPSEILPKVYYLKDREGRLQAVPGITYEQFMQGWKEQHQLAQEAELPEYSIQSLVLTGTTSGGTADLVARYTIQVHAAGWVGIPLALNDAELREPPAFAGPGEHVLDAEPERRGYIMWVRGQADQTHEVTLQLAAVVEQVGPQSRLKLSVPRTARSQFQLQVPLARAAAQVSEGTMLDSVRPLAGGKTELRLIGLANDVELSWHPADSPVASLPAILDVSGDQVIRLRGRSVSTEAKLTVRSLGSEFDRFQVRLPPGADYIGPAQPGVSLVAIDPSAAAGKLYEVRLDQKTAGPKEVRLVTERAHNAGQSEEMLQLAGFEVSGAVQQGGRVVVEIEDNWQIVWGESTNVRPVDDVGADARRQNLAGGFEYFQPYSLAARIVPQTTRIRVEPQYVLLVGSDEARLQARLKYTIRGAKVRALNVDLPGWEVDAVGPLEVVNPDAEVSLTGDSLVIPLSQATSGELELVIDAHQKVSPQNGLRLSLPQPQGDVVSASVAVVSDDNVELVPQPDQSTGLAAHGVRPQLKLPERQQDPLFYRTTGGAARFAATATVHEQAISTELATRVEVGASDSKIDQRLAFQISYQPTDQLVLLVPSRLRPESLTVVHQGQRLLPLPVQAPMAAEAEMTPLRVNLPRPTIGRCELEISYAVPHNAPPAQASARIAVPLVMPAVSEGMSNALRVTGAAGIAVSYPPGEWLKEKSEGSPDSAAVELVLSARKAVPRVVLALTATQASPQSAVVIERGWIETHLTDTGRQDWVVIRLATNQPRLQLRLPDAADLRTLVLAVDGVPVAPEASRQHELTVPLPIGPTDRHTLEVGYRFAAAARPRTVTLQPPRIEAPGWVGQFYWQLVVPQYEHVLFAPPRYDEEVRWAWADYYWQREPTLDRAELESWIRGYAPDDTTRLLRETNLKEPPGVAQNRYLFSTVGAIEPLQVSTQPRARLVLLASLPLLLVGLVLIYFPPARHPAVLFALAVLVGAAALLAPRSALLVAQSATLGLALVGVAALLARSMPKTPATVVPVHGSSQAIRERSATELYHRMSPAAPAPASTSTDPLVPSSGEVPS